MISVIIPIYNSENYIDNLLDCFCNQSYTDFELIFINDGSTDGTKEKLESLRDKYPFPISIYHQKNAGVSAARNKGIQIAKGEYICFVDADDSIFKDYLNLLFQAVFVSKCNIGMGYITRDMSAFTESHEIKYSTIDKVEFLRDFLYHGNKYHLCASIINTVILRQYNISFKEGYKYSEDVHFLWRLLARENRIAVVQAPIYYYNDNPLSAMHKLDIKRMDAIRLMESLEPYVEEFAPEFSKEFCKYAVARHHWSILWQAAASFSRYSAFKEFHRNFEMRKRLVMLFDFPDMRVSISAVIFWISERLYFLLIRFYIKLFK